MEDDDQEASEVLGISIDELTTAMAEVGNNWERVPLRHTEGREGWEEALVGCLKDVGLPSSEKCIEVNLFFFIARYNIQFPSPSRNSDKIAFLA
jgi:hypothetical protein